MRLLVVTNDYPPKPGGIQQYLGSMLDVFTGELLVLAPRDGPASATRRGEDVVVRHDREFMWPTAAVRDWVVEHVVRFAPDAVLFGAPHPLTRLIPAVKAAVRAPVGVLCHGAEVTIPAAFPGTRSLLRRWLRAADVRFAVSRFTAGRVQAFIGAECRYLGAGVDLERFVPGPHRAGPGFVVGCVSRFVPRKGQHRLIRAAAIARGNGVPAELLLVGRGRTEGALRKLAAELDVPARLFVDVPWERLPALYREMDAFAMPCKSRWGGLEVEGLGLVFLEAAASGLPVIAGDSGGAPETVRPGVTGFVATAPRHVAAAIEAIAAMEDRGASMGAAGRRMVEEEFTWDAVVERLRSGFLAAGGRRPTDP